MLFVMAGCEKMKNLVVWIAVLLFAVAYKARRVPK